MAVTGLGLQEKWVANRFIVVCASISVTGGYLKVPKDQLEKDYRIQEKTQRRLARQRETCSVCGEQIPGKSWKVAAGKYACTRCASQGPHR